MPDKNTPKGPSDPDEPKQNEPPKHKSAGREHEVHQEILRRRMRGGEEPSPDTYTRALEEWQDLPGSIVRPPSDIARPDTKKPEDQPGDKKHDKEEPKP